MSEDAALVFVLMPCSIAQAGALLQGETYMQCLLVFALSWMLPIRARSAIYPDRTLCLHALDECMLWKHDARAIQPGRTLQAFVWLHCLRRSLRQI